jgi:2-amino-4-hydroxy-6-hydroxymethyldihydropteridine diphosphokinase
MIVSYISLGSNLGDRKYYIEAAIRHIRLLTGTRVTNISKIIQTKPKGGPPQGLYLNCVIEILTSLSPHELLRRLQSIESDLGRIRTVKNGPRNIDLDILLYGTACINEASLCIPHPRMLEREFVMEPLGEIAPGIARRLKGKRAFRKRRGRVGKKQR